MNNFVLIVNVPFVIHYLVFVICPMYGWRMEIISYEDMWTVDCGLRTVDCGLWTVK